MKPILAVVLFSSAALANSMYELSSPGGSFTVGSGSTFTAFTINPFDLILPPDGAFVSQPNVGIVTIPQAEYDTSVSAGTLQITFGDSVFDDQVWAFSFSESASTILVGVELDTLVLSQDFRVGINVDAAIGTLGSQIPIGLEAVFDTVAPEPATWAMMGAGLLGIAAAGSFRKIKSPRQREAGEGGTAIMPTDTY